MVLPTILLSFASTFEKQKKNNRLLSEIADLEVLIGQILVMEEGKNGKGSSSRGGGCGGDGPPFTDSESEPDDLRATHDHGTKDLPITDTDTDDAIMKRKHSHPEDTSDSETSETEALSDSASSTSILTDSSDEEQPPVAKRRRSLEDSEETVRLFGIKLDAVRNNSFIHQGQNQTNDENVLTAGIVSTESQSTSNIRTINNTCFDNGDNYSVNSSLVCGPSTNVERDMSELSSLSSLSSFSSGDLNSLDPPWGSISNSNRRRRSIYEPTSPSPPPSQFTSQPPHFDVEFEVASLASFSTNPIEDANSSSGIDEDGPVNNMFDMKSAVSDSVTDEDDFADEEEVSNQSDDSFVYKAHHAVPNDGHISDSELSEKDLWNCSQCHAKTNTPYLRYCLRCFRIRRNWLPKRPGKRIGKKKASKQKEQRQSQNRRHTSSEEELQQGAAAVQSFPDDFIASSSTSVIPNTSASSGHSPPLHAQDIDVVDSATPSRGTDIEAQTPVTCSNIPLPPPPPPPPRLPLALDSSDTSLVGRSKSDGDDDNNTQGQSERNSPADSPDTVSAQVLKDILARIPIKIKTLRKKSTTASSLEEKDASPVCSVCMVRDKDAAFVHGKTAHVYSCYNCADKILKKNGKCPICRKRILRVVKVINS